MSTKDNATIEHVIQKIIFLLKNNNCPDWVMVFKELLRDCNTMQEEEVAKKILTLYGGMGTFNDLSFQKSYKESVSEEERKILLNENDKLNKLRRELFDACRMYRQ